MRGYSLTKLNNWLLKWAEARNLIWVEEGEKFSWKRVVWLLPPYFFRAYGQEQRRQGHLDGYFSAREETSLYFAEAVQEALAEAGMERAALGLRGVSRQEEAVLHFLQRLKSTRAPVLPGKYAPPPRSRR